MIIIKFSTKKLTEAALIAALYVTLCSISGMFGLSSGAIQLRLSEALCILPIYMQAAVPGLFVGCVISNLLVGGSVLDVVFGSLATLIGAVGTRLIGRKHKIAALFAPIISNTLIIPFVVAYAYGAEQSLSFLFVTLFAGEVLSCGVLGMLLDRFIEKSVKVKKNNIDVG